MKRNTRRVLLATSLVAIPLAIWSAPRASAVVTSTWSVDSYKDWNEGEADGALITSLGEIRPGWSTKRTELSTDGIWAAARASDGSIIVGTDDKGAIYRVRGDKASKLATIPGVVAVVSLAAGSQDTMYAGTMPSGTVWTINTKTGKAKKLATLAAKAKSGKTGKSGKAGKSATSEKAETVWALTLGASGKKLYAGTGPKGRLFSIDVATGKSRVVFETEDKRIMSLATTSDGAIWMGTSEKALVFRHDPKRNTTRAMADFAGNEVTDLAASGDGVIAIANDFAEPSTSGMKTAAAVAKATKKKDGGQKTERPATGTKPGADESTSSSAAVTRKGARKGKGTLFRVRGDSRIEQLHALTQTYFTSIAVAADGRVFAGAGDKGRIYMVATDESVSTAFDVEERITAELLYSEKDGLTFTTTDSAALYRTTGPAKTARYTSKVWDTKAPARFGRLGWRSRGALSMETRTGNTAKPGKGWSKWAAPRNIGRAGGSSFGGKVASPNGRYFQFRVTFSRAGNRGRAGNTRNSRGPVLRSAQLYFLPQNRATRLQTVSISDSSRSSSKPVTTADAAAKPRTPMMKVKWTIKNPDSDRTVYTLSVRREGEVLWRPIQTGKKELTTTSFSWNTETFPDGWYRLRVTASDRGANSADRSLESHKTSALFRVDNAKPQIDSVSVRYPRASARAVDSLSSIAEIAYSVDDGPWVIGTSQDGLLDELAEILRVELPKDLTPGAHTLSIRAADEAGNIGSTSTSFRVK